MERVYYAGDHFLTGTEIARALLDYAAALAEHGNAASVEIPVRHDDGSVGVANLLVGPASQLVTEHIDHLDDEITDDALVERLARLTEQLAPIRPVISDANRSAEPSVDYDWTDEV
jgi:hypothetical protein